MPCQRGPAHDGDSQISDADCLIRLDNFRIQRLSSDTFEDITPSLLAEKEALERKNERLARIIHSLAVEHIHAYKLSKDIIDRQIDEDGSEVRSRTMHVKALSAPLSWIPLRYGSVSPPFVQGITFDRPEVLDGDGRSLMYEFYEDGPTLKRFVVFFNTPVTVGGKEQVVRIIQRTNRVWTDLIKSLQDVAQYETRGLVEELSITVRVPTSLRITQFEVNPPIGTVEITTDGLSATWLARELPPGDYRYTVKCWRSV